MALAGNSKDQLIPRTWAERPPRTAPFVNPGWERGTEGSTAIKIDVTIKPSDHTITANFADRVISVSGRSFVALDASRIQDLALDRQQLESRTSMPPPGIKRSHTGSVEDRPSKKLRTALPTDVITRTRRESAGAETVVETGNPSHSPPHETQRPASDRTLTRAVPKRQERQEIAAKKLQTGESVRTEAEVEDYRSEKSLSGRSSKAISVKPATAAMIVTPKRLKRTKAVPKTTPEAKTVMAETVVETREGDHPLPGPSETATSAGEVQSIAPPISRTPTRSKSTQLATNDAPEAKPMTRLMKELEFVGQPEGTVTEWFSKGKWYEVPGLQPGQNPPWSMVSRVVPRKTGILRQASSRASRRGDTIEHAG